MAKSKSFFGLRKGSTKSHTYSVLDGQQVTKDRVYEVKNPRSEGQMRQRMVMTTVGAAYKYLKAIADHSFEGKTSGMQCMRAFNSANLNRFKAGAALNGSVAYNEYKDGAINPLPFQLSEGSLPTFAYSFSDDGKLALAKVADNPDLTTAEGIYKVLGVQRDDLITFCSVVGQKAMKSGVFDYTPSSFDIVRLHCDKAGSVAAIADAFTISSNSIDAGVEFIDDGNGLTIKSVVADFGAVILSRKSNGLWMRSTAFMIVKEGITNGVLTQNQFATYPVGTDLILNNGPMQNTEDSDDTPATDPLVVSPASITKSVMSDGSVTQFVTFDNDEGADVKVNVGKTGAKYEIDSSKKKVTLTWSNISADINGNVIIICGTKKATIPVKIEVSVEPGSGDENIGL